MAVWLELDQFEARSHWAPLGFAGFHTLLQSPKVKVGSEAAECEPASCGNLLRGAGGLAN